MGEIPEIGKDVPVVKKKKVTKEYVNNDNFFNLLSTYRTDRDKKSYNQIGVIFLKISNGMMNRPNFINYSYDRKCDMISDATYTMTRNIDKFDLNRKNPFAYFSQICFNAFLQSLNKQNRISNDFVSIDFIDNLDRDDSSSGSDE